MSTIFRTRSIVASCRVPIPQWIAADDGRPILAARQDDRQAAAAPYWQRSPLGLMVGGLVENGIMPKAPGAGVEVAVAPTWTAPGWRLRLLASAGFFFPRSADFS